jgi:hypothetical protein
LAGSKIAIGFVPLLVMGLVFGAYLGLVSTTSSQHPINYYNFPRVATTTNDSLGLTLSVLLNSTILVRGQTINITVFVTNERSTLNNVSSASNWSEAWLIGWGAIDSCNTFANAQVSQGYYTQSNLSTLQSGSELQLAKPLFPPLECPALSGPWFTYFPFQSDESHAGYQYSTAGNYGHANSSTSIFVLFDPGVYTVAAGDEWGQTVILHFAVVSSTKSPIAVVSVTGPIQPYNPGGPVIGMTLKNIGNISIISLSATLNLTSAEPSVPYSFVFDVNASNPLLAGNSINSTRTLVGASFDSATSYPLTINGILGNGLSFYITQLVVISPPES